MKTQFVKTLAVGCTLAITMLTTGCKENELMPEPTHSARGGINDLGVLQFNAPKFSKAIETYMNGKVSGYSYTVFRDGELVAGGGGGWARKPFESNPAKHGDQQRQDIGSVSKFVTALTAVAMLEKYDISLGDYVYPYLPVTWKPSDEFKKITFERLLAHQTGLTNYKTGWDGWQKTVEELNVDNKVRAYNNVNYSLMAVILAYVDVKKNSTFTTKELVKLESADKNWYEDGRVGARFRGLARLFVFKKAGLWFWDLVDYTTWNNTGVISAEQGTKSYPSASGNEPGKLKENLSINGGSGGLYISANEFGRIQDAAARGQIVSDTNYEIMKTKRLGFDGIVTGKHGSYYWKNGATTYDETMMFDMGRTQICVFANSSQSDINSEPSIITTAYDNAWETPTK